MGQMEIEAGTRELGYWQKLFLCIRIVIRLCSQLFKQPPVIWKAYQRSELAVVLYLPLVSTSLPLLASLQVAWRTVFLTEYVSSQSRK